MIEEEIYEYRDTVGDREKECDRDIEGDRYRYPKYRYIVLIYIALLMISLKSITM